VKEAYEVLSDLGRRRTYDETGQTKAAPSLEEEAEGLLANLFQQYLDSDETEEPLSSMRRVMNQGKTAVTDQAKAAEKSLARVAKLVGKLTRKGEGQPTLVRVLDLKVAALEAQKADLGRQLKVIHAVFKSLDQWECKGFEREPVAKRRPESVQALMDPFLNQGNPYGHR
jgi:curved DNA-binding protein CbpA